MSLWQEKEAARKKASLAMADKSGQFSKRKREFPDGVMQLFLDIKACIFSVGEATELNFMIYSADRGVFITQPYFLCLTEQGIPR